MEEILFKWIPQVGFPIVVAGYLLIRIEPKISKLVEAITELIPIVKQDSTNTEDMKKAITDFRLEVSRINGRKK
jgi:hypothetical protein